MDYDSGASGFLLPQDRLAEIVGVSQQTVSRMVRLLVAHGVLAVMDAAYSYSRKKAKVYSFDARRNSYSLAPGKTP